MLTKEHFIKQILPVTLKHEGGYANVKHDAGGETYRGISRKSNPNWPGWALLEKYKPLTNGDIVNDPALRTAVYDLYFEKYFLPLNLQNLNSALVAMQIFDFAVHGGFYVKLLQERVNRIFLKNLKADGVLGQKTIEALNSIDPVLLAHQILFLRREHLVRVIERNPTQAKFERGWNNRIDYMRHMIKHMAGGVE